MGLKCLNKYPLLSASSPYSSSTPASDNVEDENDFVVRAVLIRLLLLIGVLYCFIREVAVVADRRNRHAAVAVAAENEDGFGIILEEWGSFDFRFWYYY